MIKKFPPVVTNVPLRIRVGEHRLGADYTQGIQGHWGFTTTNMIPPRGTITRTDLGGGTADPYFSGSDSTGTIHNIGVRTTAGADNTFANHEGNVDFTMDDGYTGTEGYNSAVHKVKPLPMHGLTLNKTVTRKYGNRDKVFTFRLDMEQSWGGEAGQDLQLFPKQWCHRNHQHQKWDDRQVGRQTGRFHSSEGL